MSTTQKLAHRTESITGRPQEDAGRLTGRRRMRVAGRGDRSKGNMKLASAKVKDAFRR